jgi:hypothetical protein
LRAEVFAKPEGPAPQNELRDLGGLSLLESEEVIE